MGSTTASTTASTTSSAVRMRTLTICPRELSSHTMSPTRPANATSRTHGMMRLPWPLNSPERTISGRSLM